MTSHQADDSKGALRGGESEGVPAPNDKTIAAMLEAREIAATHRARFDLAEDLFSELDNEIRD